MEVKLAQLGNKGMYKDISISKANDEFAYHNKNIRITTVNNESLFSITNEQDATEISINSTIKTLTKNLLTVESTATSNSTTVESKFKYTTHSNVPFTLDVNYGKQYGAIFQTRSAISQPFGTSCVFKVLSKIEHVKFKDHYNGTTYQDGYMFIFGEDYETRDSDYGQYKEKFYVIKSSSTVSRTDTIFVSINPQDIPSEEEYTIYDVKIGNDTSYVIGFFEEQILVRFDRVNPPFIYNINNKLYRSINGLTESFIGFNKTLDLTFPINSKQYSLSYENLKTLINFSDSNYSETDNDDYSDGQGNTYFVNKKRMSTSNDILLTGYETSYQDIDFNYTSDPNAPDITVIYGGITGDYIGHCVCNDYIVLFVKSDGKDYIYRIEQSDNSYIAKRLFCGNLDFSTDNPLETLFYYESEDIQKVYWLDGVHQTRVINIMKEDYIDNYNFQFDFVPTVDSIPTVKIQKNFNSTGIFHSGTIQYFVTYYNKFGAESHIIWGSALHYIAPEDRGGAPDEFVSCSFTIKVSNIDDKFDYMRIYSIKRNSIDGPIEANIVADVSIKGKKTITVNDIGSNQEAIDPTMINFLGGSNFVASTFTQKDDTLFLGNIEIKDSDVSSNLKKYIKTNWIKDETFKEAIRIKFDYKCFSRAKAAGFYPHKQQINSSSISFKGFKRGEIYRFGIQYLDANGTWTQPIWIGDKECTIAPRKHDTEDWTMVPTATFERDTSAEYDNLIAGYIAYRLVMAKTDFSTRSIVTQGIVCPTMFNYKERTLNKPFSIASYIMRPRESDVEFKHLYPAKEIYGNRGVALPKYGDARQEDQSGEYTAKCDIEAKVKISYYYWEYYTKLTISIHPRLDSTNPKKVFSITSFRGYAMTEVYDEIIESIQKFGNTITSNFLSRDDHAAMHGVGTLSGSSPWNAVDDDWDNGWKIRKYTRSIDITSSNCPELVNLYTEENSDVTSEDFNTEYYIDESIVTLNSPDILDYSNQINQSGLNFRLVGIAPITAAKSDYRIYFTDDSASTLRGNLVQLPKEYYTQNISTMPCTLFKDYLYSGYASIENANHQYMKADSFADYKIYMWHKEGSICGIDPSNTVQLIGDSDDKYEPVDYTIDYIDNKLFSTERFSIDTEYFTAVNIGISKPEVFNSDGIAIEKVELPTETGTYYGNYSNSFIPFDKTIPVKSLPYGCVNVKSYDPVSINYNTTAHAVFTLMKDVVESGITHKKLTLLPLLSSDSSFEDITDYTFLKPSTGQEISDAITNGTIKEWKSYGIFYFSSNTNVSVIMSYIRSEAQHYIHLAGLDNEAIVYALVSNSITTSSYPYIRYVFKVTNSAGYPVEMVTEGFESSVITFHGSGGNYPYFGRVSSSDYYQYNPTTHHIAVPTSYLSHSYERLATIDYSTQYPYLFIGELYRSIPYNSLYGGYDENAIEKITWIPICGATKLTNNISKTEGDTYYQRWDCVKTTPSNLKSSNSIFDITSVMLESHQCLDGRYDRNRGGDDILNISVDNFNLFNTAYNQSNDLFSYNILDDKYDLDKFKNQIVWSRQKSLTEDIDTWTNISQLNSIYLDGQYGPINKLINFNDTIVAFQDKAIAGINFNNQIQVSTEQGLPIEVVNSGKVTGYNYISRINGCHNKWSINEANSGLFFIDDYNKSLFRFNKEGLTNLSSSLGFSKWFKDNISMKTWTINNDAFRLSSDRIKHDVYIIKDANEGCLCYNEDTGTFTSFYTNYEKAISIFNINGKSFYLNKGLKLNEMFTGDYLRDFSVEYKVNPEPLEDKIFTNIEYISDTIEDGVKNKNNPFKTLEVKTEYQRGTTNLLNPNYPNSASKFRLWRGDIPRDSVNKLDRIRNPWINLKLVGNNDITGLTTLHSLIVKYFK